MLVRLSRRGTVWAAYCDDCLASSPVVTFDAPTIARAWAIDRFQSQGWTHVAPTDIPASGVEHAIRAWTGETYCFECSTSRQRKQA